MCMSNRDRWQMDGSTTFKREGGSWGNFSRSSFLLFLPLPRDLPVFPPFFFSSGSISILLFGCWATLDGVFWSRVPAEIQRSSCVRGTALSSCLFDLKVLSKSSSLDGVFSDKCARRTPRLYMRVSWLSPSLRVDVEVVVRVHQFSSLGGVRWRNCNKKVLKDVYVSLRVSSFSVIGSSLILLIITLGWSLHEQLNLESPSFVDESSASFFSSQNSLNPGRIFFVWPCYCHLGLFLLCVSLLCFPSASYSHFAHLPTGFYFLILAPLSAVFSMLHRQQSCENSQQNVADVDGHSLAELCHMGCAFNIYRRYF